MEFIDHTGHFFTQKSYNEYPNAYEFETLPYVFWLNTQYTNNLSIDNYYMLPIRPLIEKERYGNIKSISIKSQSNIFKLVASQRIQDGLNEKKSLTIELSENSDDLKDELVKDDILLIEDDKFIMLPFYIIGNSQYEGTFTTTILIHVSFENDIEIYCPITIGGVWVDEIEQLQINASNMGVNLPKDIIKAVYQGSLVNDKLDTALYNDKVKEYLINYMTIKGECGNTNSVLNSLKWFGYGDKITIDKLLRTDNDLFTQYVHDNLSLKNDIIEGFEHFVNTSLFTLVIKENEDLDNIPFKFNSNDSDFWGENNPETMSLFDKLVESKYDEEDIVFYKPYYEFTLQEMFIKLSCLKYYYQKYFLPLHVGIYSASIQHKEYCNDIKFTIKPFNAICANLTILNDADVKVTFPEDNNIYLYNQIHYVDDLYNEFTDYEKLGNETDMSIYYTDDICFSIPIKITGDKYYRCKILLARNDNKVIYESSFNFAQSIDPEHPERPEHDYKSLVILPKIINKLDNINYWLNYTYVLYVCVNDKWFEYPFTLNIPELNISFGTLEYKYDSEREKQMQSVKNFTNIITENNSNLSSDEINKIIRNFITEENSSIYNVAFNACMYLPYLVSVNNINFCKNVVDYITKDNLLSFISKYRELPNISSSKKYYNRVHYFDLYEEIKGENDKPIDVQIKYENNKQLIGDLYRDFFDEEGNLKNIFDKYKYTFSNYDFYLMHDSENPEYYKGILPDSVLTNWTPHWYVVFISKQTIDKADLLIEDSFTIHSNNKNYKLKHVASDNKFLINRMNLKDSGGVNIFNSDDIIVSTINNINMPFILELGSHWNFKPFSLGMNKEANVYSNTNSAIISMGQGNIKYERGYYDVNVRYSLDGNTQEQITKRARILVN